jgi:hypothetical protein
MTTQKNIAVFFIKHLFSWAVLCMGSLHGASEFPVNATINNGTFTINQGMGEYPSLTNGWMAFPSKIEYYQTVISRGKATVTFSVQSGDTNILRDIHVAFAGGPSSGSYYAGGISAAIGGWGNLTSVVRRGTSPQQDLAYYNTGGEKVTIDKIGTNAIPVLKYASLSSIIYDFRVTINSTDKYLLIEAKINPNTPSTIKSATKAADQLYSPLFLYRTTGTEIPDNLGYVAFSSWNNRLGYQNIATSTAIDPIALYNTALKTAQDAVTAKISNLNTATTSTQINAITDTDASITALTDALSVATKNRTILAELSAYTDTESTTLIASLSAAWTNFKSRRANLPVDDLKVADEAVRKQTNNLNAATDANRQSLIDETQAIIDTFKNKNNALIGNAAAIAAAGVLYNPDYTQQANIVLLITARNAAKTAMVTSITSKITAFTDAISGSLNGLITAINDNINPSITTQNALAAAITAAGSNLTALNTLLTTGAANPSAIAAAITANTVTPTDNATLTATVAAANSLLGNTLKGIDSAITTLAGRLTTTPLDNTALSDANAYASTMIAALNTAYSALVGNSAAQTIAGTAYTSYTSATVNNGVTLTNKITAAKNAHNNALVSALQIAANEVTNLTGRLDATATASDAYNEAIAIPSTPPGNTLTKAALKNKALQDANDALKGNQDAITLAGTLYSTEAVHPHTKALNERIQTAQQKAQDLLNALNKANTQAAIPLIGTVVKATSSVIAALNGLSATTENVATVLQTNLITAFPTAAEKAAFLAAYASAATVTGSTTQADSLITSLQKAIDDINTYGAAKTEATKANAQGSTALSSALQTLSTLQTAWTSAQKLKAALDLQVTVNNQILIAKLNDANKAVTELTGRLNAVDAATAAYDEAVKIPAIPAGNTLTVAALKNKALQEANDSLTGNKDAIALAGTLYSTDTVHPDAKALNKRLGEIQEAKIGAVQNVQRLLQELDKAGAAAAIPLVDTVAKATPAVIKALDGLTTTTENVAATLQTNLNIAFPTPAAKAAFLAAYATATTVTGATTQIESLIIGLQTAIDNVITNEAASAQGITALNKAQQSLGALNNAKKLKVALDLQASIPAPGASSGSGLGNSSSGGLGAGNTDSGTTGLGNTPSTGTGSSPTGLGSSSNTGTGSSSSTGGSNTNNGSTRGSGSSGSGLGLGGGSIGGLGLGTGLGATPRTDQQLAADVISANSAIVTYTKTVKNPLTKSVANTKAKLLKDALTKAMTAIKGKTNAIKSAGAAYSTKNPHPSIAALDAAIKKLKS